MVILASDFDDTIYFPEDRKRTIENAKAIRNFVSYGNTFCIITGRTYSVLKTFLQEFEIPYSYLICEDGAKIFNSVDYCLDTVGLSEEESKKIVEIIKDTGFNYYLSDGYNQTENYNDCVKVVIECENKDSQEELVEMIKSQMPIHVYASRSHVNIIHNSVNKEKAIKRLFNIEGLDYSKLKVIGDNDNDYEMIKSFDGVVIKKHHEKLNELKKKEYETLSDYIKELMKD